MADSLLQRAQSEVDRVKGLVAEGILPRSQLAEAERRLADAQDQDTLARTLYGSLPVEKMTQEQARDMHQAAERRVSRQEVDIDAARNLLANGIIAPTELQNMEVELANRRHVLQLTELRLQLLADLKQMAEREKEAELHPQSGTLKDSMIRFDGSAPFALSDLPSLSARFERKFGHPLPVSALGQTRVHTELGLDHRNRADIALNPESKEGLWFRHLLEQLKLSYLAFRSAVAGAATAPHIHIGTGSSRLNLAGR